MKKIPNTLSFTLFFAGVLLGLAIALFSTWAGFEANFYGFTKQTKNPLRGLSCPVMMAANENSSITIEVVNTSDKPIAPNVKTEISSPFTPVSSLDFLDLAPGESVTLTKKISPENVDLGRFIFVKALVYAAYPMPDQESTCGVYVLPMRGNGTAFLIGGIILSLLLTGGGAYLLRKSDVRQKYVTPLLFIATLVIPAMAFSILGWWVPTGFVIVILLLTLAVALGNFVMG